jgi:dephospho-CoA kinase
MKGRIFGLTGGIACGKSVVSQVFSAQGVPMVDADVVARAIVAPGTQALSLLVSQFGEEILLPDGSLDRPTLGAIVFADPKKRASLDRILLRYLQDEIKVRLREASEHYPLVGFEAPLLVERGYHNEYRPVVVVASAPEVQLKRLMERDGFTEAEAQARIDSQLPLNEKVAVADYVIWNNGSRDDLIKEALHVLPKIKHP